MEKRVVLITGASKGIGRAIAEQLSPKCTVILTGRNRAGLAEVESEIRSRGGDALAVPGDVTVEEEVSRTVEIVQGRFGRIDVLVNNAGMGTFRRIDEFAANEFEEMWRVNVFGTFLFTKYAIPGMIERGSGQIINIASVAGINGFKGGSAYASAKFAVMGFTESLREDVKEFGIAVSVICPGLVRTGFGGHDPGSMNSEYMLEPEDVAHSVEYLVNESETANTKMIELKPRRRSEYRPGSNI